MTPMQQRVASLVGRVLDLADTVARYGRRAAAVIGGAALVVAGVLRLEPPLGFGWNVPGWWLLALLALVPAAIVAWFAISAGRIGVVVQGWPQRLAGAADAGLDTAIEVAGAARSAIERRRGFLGLANGVWGLRKLAGEVRGLLGETAPTFAAFSPPYLLATALSLLAGIGLLALATLLVLTRLVT